MSKVKVPAIYMLWDFVPASGTRALAYINESARQVSKLTKLKTSQISSISIVRDKYL